MRYLYLVAGLLLVAISPYVVVYEGQTLFGVAFAVLGVALLADELFRDGESDEEDGKEADAETNDDG